MRGRPVWCYSRLHIPPPNTQAQDYRPACRCQESRMDPGPVRLSYRLQRAAEDLRNAAPSCLFLFYR